MVDEVRITVKAGDGGDGKVSFRRLKYQPKGGPDGGDGGHGGSVYFVGDRNMNTLRSFSGHRTYAAGNGENGGKDRKHGGNGSDLRVRIPVGTLVRHAGVPTGPVIAEMLRDGQEIEIARGGRGGRGNDAFKSSTRQAPMHAERGEKHDPVVLELELRLLANVGLVGLPNAGKSTLLSVLTKATPQIANYPFTTLEPNLGVMYDGQSKNSLVLADLPGLIEGASTGKGLGHRFLRHIERCEVILFVLYLEDSMLEDAQNDPAGAAKKLSEQYELLLAELSDFDPALLSKTQVIGISKSDLYSDAVKKAMMSEFKKRQLKTFLFSSVTGEGMEEVKGALFEESRKS